MFNFTFMKCSQNTSRCMFKLFSMFEVPSWHCKVVPFQVRVIPEQKQILIPMICNCCRYMTQGSPLSTVIHHSVPVICNCCKWTWEEALGTKCWTSVVRMELFGRDGKPGSGYLSLLMISYYLPRELHILPFSLSHSVKIPCAVSTG